MHFLNFKGIQKAEKNRNRVEEEFLKSTHAARAEAAAQRREEKRKQEKERILAEDDRSRKAASLGGKGTKTSG